MVREAAGRGASTTPTTTPGHHDADRAHRADARAVRGHLDAHANASAHARSAPRSHGHLDTHANTDAHGDSDTHTARGHLDTHAQRGLGRPR